MLTWLSVSPGPGEAGADSNGSAFATGEQGTFHVPLCNNELQSERGVVGDELGLRLAEVGDSVSGDPGRS